MIEKLITARGEHLLRSGEIPWSQYPRPQMKRDSYVNLNGHWDFTVRHEKHLPVTYDRTILVPFCPESQLSGVETHFSEGSFLFYRRNFVLPQDFCRGRVLLHIGGADQIAKIYVNQKLLATHTGGYEAFTVDITDALEAENELVICCVDDLRDLSMPYGKQTQNRGGMWYTPVSGIWQTVWLESVPQTYIQKLRIQNRGDSVTVTVEPKLEGTLAVRDLGEFSLTEGSVTIAPEDPHRWSPEDPYLYEFTLEAGEDRVESYFAIRSLEIREADGYPRLCLNGEPYFFHGLLDQGYWPEGLLTPPAPESYTDDILAMKELGFNMLRKHIKVEPEEFYYQCDRLGMVVFQDMVNNGDYAYLRDTVLPTLGLQVLEDRKLHKDAAARQAFLRGMEAAVRQLENHPSICYWTIFNEGWGQFDADSVYDVLKKLDDTRFIDSTSGWFRRSRTDVDSRHVYFRPVKLTAGEKPLVLSEFGGYSYQPKGHVFNPGKAYGYGKFEDADSWNDAVEKLYLEQVVPACRKGLCAAVYTQVSDIEDETNGLLTYDRKVCKANAERFRKIARLLR